MKNKKNGAAFYTVKGDFTSKDIKERTLEILSSRVNEEDKRKTLEINCVISDMAVNFTGDQLTDALRTMNLCEEALMFAAGSSCFDDEPVADDASLLCQGGTFLCKFFACGQSYEEDLMNAAAKSFEYTSIIKPNASRKKSAEMYLFASGFKKFDGRI
jgi:23S rRNA (uridine2552-2'-O)-methyltransferase